jgi:undecaprenyl diphosphate synthase
MDGNGRWARKRHLPRFAGHKAGLDATRNTVEYCDAKGIKALTIFAFSSENWRRPKEEVGLLMNLFITALRREIKKLHKKNVRMQFIGDRSAFSAKLQKEIDNAEKLTKNNTGLSFNIAANYGGQWDITEAARKVALKVSEGVLRPEDITSETLSTHMTLASLPAPDLFIRTGGEKRISNFLLWQLAYTELYFTDALWPDFDNAEFESALADYSLRQRRFGRTGEQVEEARENA